MIRAIASLLLAALLSLAMAGGANAQFPDQQTWAGTSGGSANAQTITVPNVATMTDLVGVTVRFVAGFTNTASTTLNVNGITAVTIRKSVGGGLTTLAGREIAAGAVVGATYDGTQFQLVASLQSPPECVSMLTYSAVGDGATDNSTPLLNAFAAVSASGTGGCLSFPAGKFRFNAQVALNFPSSLYGLRIVGAGQDATVLYWPNAGNGLVLNENNVANSFHIENLTFSTGAANGGTGIGLTANQGATCPGGFPGPFGLSYVRGVTFRGDDNDVNFYWSTAALVNKVSGTNWDAVLVYGAAVGLGNGILFQGDSVQPCYSIQHNISKSTFGSTAVAITFGKYLQGLTISQSNLTNYIVGIQVPAATAGTLSQLSVSDSQFNSNLGGDAMQITTQTSPLLIHGNLIFVDTNRNGIAINVADVGFGVGVTASITGNAFVGISGSTNNNGLIVVSGSEIMTTGNTFTLLAGGIVMQASALSTNTQSNYYQGNTCGVNVGASCVFTNNSASNIVGGGNGTP